MNAGSGKVMGPGEWALLVSLSAIWGWSFFLAKIALAELSPTAIVLGRVTIAAVALDVLVWAGGWRMPGSLRVWVAFFVMGALNNLIPFSLLFWSQTRIASGLVAILNATTPLFTVVLAHVLTRDERLTPNRLVGVLAGLAGVAVMIGGDALWGLAHHVVAQVAVLGAALSYAFAGLYGRRFREQPPLVTAAAQATASTAMLLPIFTLVDRPAVWLRLSGGTWVALAVLALVGTALAYVIYFRLLASAGATNLLLVTFLVPVSALILGTTFLGERFSLRHFGGMALIAVGLAAIDGRPVRWLTVWRSSTAVAAPVGTEYSPQPREDR
jgi:drug/metabolite transporter (DMT)-like permease